LSRTSRVSRVESLDLLLPFATFLSQHTNELAIAIEQSGMFFADLGLDCKLVG
jgi:hypothetical protein